MAKKENKSKIGPVQLLAIGFVPEAKFEGKILEELERLDKLKTIRILDLLFVKKDKETEDLVVLSIQEEKLGAIVGALMGFDFEGEAKKDKDSEKDEENNAFGLSTKQIMEIGHSVKPGMAAGVLLIEHVWAKQLKDAIRQTGGFPIAEGFLTPEAISQVSTEITAMASAMDELEQEEKEEHTMRAYN